MPSSPRLKFLALTLCAAVLVAGCRPKPGASGGGPTGAAGGAQVFKYPLPTKPTTLDPSTVQDGDTIDLHLQVFSGLVTWNDKNEVVPDIAEKWEISNGGKTYTFKLKDNVYFHAPFKRKVTAQDFVYSLSRAITNKASATSETYLGDILGSKEAKKGKATTVSGLKAIDDRTLEITIDGPKSYFPSKLTYSCAFVVCKEAIEKNGGKFDEKQMIGTGPFMLKEFGALKVVLVANPDYFGQKPILAGIERPVILDSTARQNAYESGQVDLTSVQLGDLDRIRGSFPNEVKEFLRANTWYVSLNQKAYEPFKNRDVRQAFAYAINKDEIVKLALKGTSRRAEGVLPPGVFGYDEKFKGLDFNPEKARALLAKAGYAGGKGLPRFTISFRQGYKEIEDAALMIREDLKKNLGIDVDVQKIEWAQFLTLRDQGVLPVSHLRWGADYLDAQNFLSTLLHTGVRENSIGYSNPEFDKLCDQADVEQDPVKRKALYNQAERIVVDDAPWVCIHHKKDVELIKPYVKGIRDGLLGHLPHITTTVAR